MEVLLQILLLVVGFFLLVKGADWFVDGASGIASRLGVPQLVIGLTIVAMGTSAPEAAISISSSLKGSADIAVGNVLGSNIMNVLLILGITALLTPLAIQKSTIRYEIPFLFVITILLMALGMRDHQITFLEGCILWVFFLIYMAYLFMMAKNGEETQEENQQNTSWIKLILYVIIGAVFIVVGSDVSVDAAKRLATMFGMSPRLIGLTIVAFGTSLPELVTCIVAGMKKNADIVIGNIIGSNIFNILFVLGTSALFTTVAYQPEFLFDSIVCIATIVLLFICVLNKQKELRKYGGVLMLVGYAGYFAYLILQ